MTSKDRDNKTLHDKVKFYIQKKLKGSSGNIKDESGFVSTPELEKELSFETPTPQRLKAIKELHDKVRTHRLTDQNAVEKLWLSIADLIQPEQPKEARHIALLFLQNLIVGQYDLLKIMRAQFFRIIKEHNHPEDTKWRLALLQTLTNEGKDITNFEGEIFKFMLQWMPSITNVDLTKEFLGLLVNLIKFNAASMSKEITAGFVNNTCFLCCETPDVQVGIDCLYVLEAIVCYSIFPHESLQIFVSALCRMVNVEYYCPISWKVMRYMLGTDLGHSALHVMCVALGTTASGDCHLARGAVFYLNMALWGSKRVTTLKCIPTQVLPSFLKALEGGQSIVTYEVILAMQTLVNKQGQDLHEPAWDLVFAIIMTVVKQIEGNQSPSKLIVTHLHETITSIEQIYESGHFYGSVENMYNLINACGHSRHDESVFKLITYLTNQIVPTNNKWLTTLNKLVEQYCRQEFRVNIRLKVLQNLQVIFEQNRSSYEEELLDKVILPNLQHCSTEADPVIRCASAKLLVEIALHCHSKRFSDLFDILEKLLNRPFELYVTAEPISLSPDTDVSDISAVASGIINIFLHKLHKLPSSHAVRAYSTVINHLQQHYARPSFFEYHPSIRLRLLEWLLSARANSMYHIGFPLEKGGRVYFSPYICIEGGDDVLKSSHSPPAQPVHQISNLQTQISYVSIRKACNIIIMCLKQEKDWSVLQVVLREIPNIMQNKALVLSKNSNDIDLLAFALCSMVADKSLPETLYNTSPKLTQSEFHAFTLPVLTCLAPYHAQLDTQLQTRIITCNFKFGLVVVPCVQQCITALTIFTLEMRDTMAKLLPDVLLDLSKISATVMIAVPILEFLSTITRLPKLFSSFVGDQYMSVFAILLPYTNLFKYNHYIVSLAHHVIAAWFLKCRLPFRRDFVKFIKNGLYNNIIKPFEEGKQKQDFADLNQDSSNRKRSSSLTEQGSRRRELPSRPTLGELRTPQEASNMFYIELTETCIDLMARYTYSQCITAPKRSPTADFLLSGGPSMTWLLGHKIITITTSGCSQNTLRQGLCDRCLVLCKAHADSLQSPSGTGNNTAGSNEDGSLQTAPTDVKRYTKHSLQHSKSNETTNSYSSVMDNNLIPPSCHYPHSLQSMSGRSTRQNSSENKNDASSNSPKGCFDNDGVPTSQLNLKLENLANKQISDEKSHSTMSNRLERVISGINMKPIGINSGSSTGNAGLPESRLHCACWCGSWAEVYVRSPTGDVSWMIHLQNQLSIDTSFSDVPLSDISSLFLPSLGNCETLSSTMPLGSAASIASSGFQDAKSDVLSDDDPRSRSGSGGSQPDQIQKSNSDSVVMSNNVSNTSAAMLMKLRYPHAGTFFLNSTQTTSSTPTTTTLPANSNQSHAATGPINIPGSPQRQSSSGTNTDDEDGQSNTNDPLHPSDEQGKSRHTVKRSNSSPEMSSSWKNPAHLRECLETIVNESGGMKEIFRDLDDRTNDNNASCEFQDLSYYKADETSNMQQPKKGAVKSHSKDMRVSCEAIPEEISSNTPPTIQQHPHSHPHLMTYNSDPGSGLPVAVDAPQVSTTSMSEKNIVSLANQHDNATNGMKTQSVSDFNVKSIKAPEQTSKNINLTIDKTHDFLKVSAKPPHSPAPASPRPVNRVQNIQNNNRTNATNPALGIRNSSFGSSDAMRNISHLNLKLNEAQANQQQQFFSSDDLPPLSRSKRSNTISVMSPTRKRKDNSSPKPKDSSSRSGISPAFVFLQLYHSSSAENSKMESPLLISGSQQIRSIKNLDLIPPLETYRIGVLYVGKGQHDNETKILKNEFGSLRYAEFLQDLGTLISLEDAESMGLFLDVEKGGRDGRFAYVWQDDIMQVHFHVATLMPNNSSDPECNEKRKHIGNDFVSIVYNESGEDFLIQTIKGQFNFACIIIEPLDHGTNKVTIKTKDELAKKDFLIQTEPKIISDQNVALFARQLALHANLASLISRSLNSKAVVPYASNWLERLRAIKRLKNKLLEDQNNSQESTKIYHSSDTRRSPMEDFTEYT